MHRSSFLIHKSSVEEENWEKWGRKRERGGRWSAEEKKGEENEGEGSDRVGRKKKTSGPEKKKGRK